MRARATGRRLLALASVVASSLCLATVSACAYVSGLSGFATGGFASGGDEGATVGEDAEAQPDATGGESGAEAQSLDSGADAAPADATGGSGGIDAAGVDGSAARAEAGADAASRDASSPWPSLTSLGEVCKLISDTTQDDPTPNGAQTGANLLGTDLGIPVDLSGTLYFFFGDSWGYAGIWQQGQSHPDTVGYAIDSTSAVTATPDLLCSDLRFLTLSPSVSVGPTVNSSVIADFAAAAMTAPAGGSLSTYIHNPSGGDGTQTWPKLPGSFEVPSGAFVSDGSIYVFYTTVDSNSDPTMVASYLAQWSSPSTGGTPGYQILYSVDERVDSAGPLYGNFVNIAAETASDGYVYMFGTGAYRASAVYLARKSLSALAAAGGFELYDATSGTWGTVEGAPIIDVPGYGETSVRYFASIDKWMFLAEENYQGNNQIVARFASQPEGPWSGDVVVADMANAAFLGTYCCGTTCTGQELFVDCGMSGGGAFYGSYMLPGVITGSDGSFTVGFTMSTWNLYNVALMQATFR